MPEKNIDPMVVFDQVSKRFGDVTAVDSIDLDIERGNSCPSWGLPVAAKPRPYGCLPVWRSRAKERSASMAND
ncbi:MAG: hypothetical protein Ct9H300mP16_03220 [Pseudomonadota bacterium]|nr:MAG: hypothetical protein Ct9H300mP16_03220 [Pseudomonadota bacterium]